MWLTEPAEDLGVVLLEVGDHVPAPAGDCEARLLAAWSLDQLDDLGRRHRADQPTVVVDDDAATGRRGQRRVEGRAQRAALGRERAAAVQLFREPTVPGRRRSRVSSQPCGWRWSSTTSTQPSGAGRDVAAAARRLGLVVGRQRAGRLEGQRPIAAVAADEAGDEVVGRAVSSSAGGASWASLPPTRMTATWSPSLTASSMSWVTKTMVLPSSPCSRRNSSCSSCAHDRVDRAERLVHQHHRRVGGQRPGHADPLLLAAGELGRIALGELRVQADPLEQLHRPRTGLALALPEQQRHGRDVVHDGAVREQSGVLDDVADAAAQLGASRSSRCPCRRARCARRSARSSG